MSDDNSATHYAIVQIFFVYNYATFFVMRRCGLINLDPQRQILSFRFHLLLKKRKALQVSNKIAQNKIKNFAAENDIRFFAKLFFSLINFVFIVEV